MLEFRLESGRSRLLIIMILISILIFFFIWYGSLEPDPDKGSYPNEKQLFEDYNSYVGEKVELGGRVVETDPIKIEIESSSETMALNITSVEKSVSEGDRLTVYGVVEDDKTIDAENVVIQPFVNWVYMYLISGVAAVWVFLRIVKYWRWDPETASLKVRVEPLRLTDMISREEGGRDHG